MLCKELTTCQHLEWRDCSVNAHQLKLLFASIQCNSTLACLASAVVFWSSESEADLAWNAETTLALNEMIEKNSTLTSLWLRPCARNLAVSLGQALAKNSSLVSVEISSNRFISSNVDAILKGIELSASRALENTLTPAFQVLTLHECCLKDEQMLPMAQFLSSSCCACLERIGPLLQQYRAEWL